MPRIDALPGIKIIRGFHGVLDFYMQRGRAYVRSWPRTPRHHLTPATLAAAATFGQVLKSYRLLAETVLVAFQEDAADHERTARDIYVAAVHGHLHEAAMTDFLTALQACRDSLAALEALLGALGSVNTDDIQVDVKTSALPDGAATAAHQVTQNTSLATIATLEEALESVATDRLIIRGENQLFSLKAVVEDDVSGIISDAGGYIQLTGPTDTEFWVITNARARDATSACTQILLSCNRAGTNQFFHQEVKAFPADLRTFWDGMIVLDTNDNLRAYFIGALAGDTVSLGVRGYEITRET